MKERVDSANKVVVEEEVVADEAVATTRRTARRAETTLRRTETMGHAGRRTAETVQQVREVAHNKETNRQGRTMVRTVKDVVGTAETQGNMGGSTAHCARRT